MLTIPLERVMRYDATGLLPTYDGAVHETFVDVVAVATVVAGTEAIAFGHVLSRMSSIHQPMA